ncbi:MAG: sugar-binding protein [Candidatus Hydrogenedentota bacterium]
MIRTRVFAAGLLLLALSLLQGAVEAGSARLAAVRTDAEIRIDGTLDEEAWKTAAPVDLKHTRSRDGSTCTARILWDDDRIYIAFDALDRQVETAGEDDWNDDGVAVSFMVDGNLHKFRFDIGGTGEGIGHTVAGKLKPGTTLSKTSDEDQGYTVEFSVPWKTLGFIPRPGSTIAMDFVSIDHDFAPGKKHDAAGVSFSKLSLDRDFNIDTCKNLLPLIVTSGDDFLLGPVPLENGFVTNWLVAGPWPTESIDEDFLGGESGVKPARGSAAGDRTWKTAFSGEMFDLEDPDAFDTFDDGVGYAAACIWSETERAALLGAGSDDGIKIWLNGRCIWRNDAARWVQIGEDKINIVLRKGWNTVLCKVKDLGGGCGMSLKISDRKGDAMPALKQAIEPDR